MSALAELIDNAAIERELGADDREIESLEPGERKKRLGTAHIHRQDAGIARDAHAFPRRWLPRFRCRARPANERMFRLATRPDDENLHAASPRRAKGSLFRIQTISISCL